MWKRKAGGEYSIEFSVQFGGRDGGRSWERVAMGHFLRNVFPFTLSRYELGPRERKDAPACNVLSYARNSTS